MQEQGQVFLREGYSKEEVQATCLQREGLEEEHLLRQPPEEAHGEVQC